MARVLELKKRLRTEILAQRRSLSQGARANAGEAVVTAFFKKFPEVLDPPVSGGVCAAPASGPKRIGVFRPIKDEITLDPLFQKLITAGTILYFPRVESDDPPLLKFFAADPFREELWVKARFGLLEPLPYFESAASELDFILVPLVAVDGEGNRIGYGKGHYDSALKNRGTAQAIGIGFDFQKVDSIPVEKHDVKLDGVVLV